MRPIFGVAGLALGACVLVIPQSTFAAPRCGPAAELDRNLAPDKGYLRLGRGTTSDGTIIDVYVAPMTASWVAVARLAPSRSCIITEGKNWRSDVHAPAPELPTGGPSS